MHAMIGSYTKTSGQLGHMQIRIRVQIDSYSTLQQLFIYSYTRFACTQLHAKYCKYIQPAIPSELCMYHAYSHYRILTHNKASKRVSRGIYEVHQIYYHIKFGKITTPTAQCHILHQWCSICTPHFLQCMLTYLYTSKDFR